MEQQINQAEIAIENDKTLSEELKEKMRRYKKNPGEDKKKKKTRRSNYNKKKPVEIETEKEDEGKGEDKLKRIRTRPRAYKHLCSLCFKDCRSKHGYGSAPCFHHFHFNCLKTRRKILRAPIQGFFQCPGLGSKRCGKPVSYSIAYIQ